MSKILVVDNEPDLRDDLAWAAKGEGREVMTADGREQALSLIEQHEFDVIITDLKMETNEAGLDVLRAAKNKNIDTQVIVITAYGTPEISVETIRLGAFDYLERNAPGTSTLDMIKYKIGLALEFGNAMQKREDQR